MHGILDAGRSLDLIFSPEAESSRCSPRSPRLAAHASAVLRLSFIFRAVFGLVSWDTLHSGQWAVKKTASSAKRFEGYGLFLLGRNKTAGNLSVIHSCPTLVWLASIFKTNSHTHPSPSRSTPYLPVFSIAVIHFPLFRTLKAPSLLM